jgi:hypothetical protein
MKKHIALFIISSMFLCETYTQNTGYMGKHFLLNAEANFSPAYFNSNSYGKSLVHNLDYSAFNFILSPSVEAIVWKKGTVGAGYNFFTSYYRANYQILLDDEADIGNVIYLNKYMFYDPTYRIKSHGCHLFYKQYIGDTYAPLGHYLKFTVDVFFNKHVFNDVLPDTLIALGYANDSRFLKTPQKSMLFGFKVEYGYDFLLFNRLKLLTGISLGTTFGGYKAKLNDWLDSYGNDDIEGIESVEYGKSRLLNAYWFGLKVGIGILTI